MIVEIEKDTRDFATICKSDYLRKKGVKPIECKPLSHYPPPLNILNGPFKHYLNTRLENQLLPENERSEDPEDYLNKMHNEFPYSRKVLPIVPNEKMIKRRKNKFKGSVYQIDYFGELIADEYFRLQTDRPKEVTLPEDWITPESVQRYTYQDPWASPMKDLIKPLKIGKPPNNLDPDLKEREILQVTTGHSEYMGEIGATGEKIMQEDC